MNDEFTIWEQGYIKGLKFIPYDVKLEANILGMNEGKMAERMIRPIHKKASKPTHGFYRGIILPIAQSSELFRGWNRKDIHNHFKDLFLRNVKELQMGTATVIIVDIESTEGASQKKMNQFINDVRQYLAEKNISTPDPVKQPII